MAERRFKGKASSPGLAIGPLVHLDQGSPSTKRRGGSTKDERVALEQAIIKAASDLEALSTVASGDGAAILAFQIEMLDDPALTEAVWPLIDQGRDAVQAWKTGLDAEIEGYLLADDDYFRARASDLEDLRDRVARALEGVSSTLPSLPDGALLLARDLPPSLFLALDYRKLGGILLTEGSATSHVAMLVRARGLPMIVGLDATIQDLGKAPLSQGRADADGMLADGILNADDGYLLIAPTATTRRRYEKQRDAQKQAALEAASRRDHPAVTADGQIISVMVNVDDPTAIDEAILKAADGVGLLRTEFLLIGRPDLPCEEEQLRIYMDLQERLGGKQLIIRSFDIGGDKPLPTLDLPKEDNPFLGLRGIRLCLDRPDFFRPQVRALLRAKANGPVDVMLPMVTVQDEIEETRRLFKNCLQDLQKEGKKASMPRLGVMVETPAAALTIDQLEADFFSIGSNDLVQYVMAAARDGRGRVADLLDPAQPAITRLLKMTVDQAKAGDKDVSLCGDMASDPSNLPLVLSAGLRKISVQPAAFDRVKAAIERIDLSKLPHHPS